MSSERERESRSGTPGGELRRREHGYEKVTVEDLAAVLDILQATGLSYVKARDIANVLDTHTRRFNHALNAAREGGVVSAWSRAGSNQGTTWKLEMVVGRDYDYSDSRDVEVDVEVGVNTDDD